jgi:hypothetical protein
MKKNEPSPLEYSDPGSVSFAAAISAREQNRIQELPSILISVALYEENPELASAYCLSLVTHENENVRGNAVLGLGHIARRFGHLPTEAMVAIFSAQNDKSEYVRGHAYDAADDVQKFIG